MTKKRTLSALSIAGLLTILISSVAPTVLVAAQTAPKAANVGQALEIGPPVLNLSANPGQTITANLSLRDVTAGSLVVTNQINDFIAGGEDGTPKIILDNTTISPYSLKQWIKPVPQITLKSREIKNISLTISVPANASPGGYYGVIRFTGNAPNLDTSGVSLSASLGALVLLKVNGEAKEAIGIEQFFASDMGTPGTLFESAPITFIERLKNTGNIHEQPSGIVTISDMFNNKIVTLGVNQPPHDILPSSIRKFESALDSTNIGNKILFGLYHAKLDVTYGANKQTTSSEFTFWVIPYRLIGLGVIVIIGGFFTLRYFIKRYNRMIVSRATGVKHTKNKTKKE